MVQKLFCFFLSFCFSASSSYRRPPLCSFSSSMFPFSLSQSSGTTVRLQPYWLLHFDYSHTSLNNSASFLTQHCQKRAVAQQHFSTRTASRSSQSQITLHELCAIWQIVQTYLLHLLRSGRLQTGLVAESEIATCTGNVWVVNAKLSLWDKTMTFSSGKFHPSNQVLPWGTKTSCLCAALAASWHLQLASMSFMAELISLVSLVTLKASQTITEPELQHTNTSAAERIQPYALSSPQKKHCWTGRMETTCRQSRKAMVEGSPARKFSVRPRSSPAKAIKVEGNHASLGQDDVRGFMLAVTCGKSPFTC